MRDTIEHNDFEWRGARQYRAVMTANLIMLGQGCIIGWYSPALPKLLSKDTPLVEGPLTSSQVSWAGSFSPAGALFGTIIFGFITSCLGCKRAMLLLSIPSILFWLLIYFGDRFWHILASRFFCGLIEGGGMTTVVLYTSEISNDNIRGRLGSFTQLSLNIGICIAYVLGSIVDYKFIPCICVLIPLLYVISFAKLPNTPQFHLRRQNLDKAYDALKYYKLYKGKTEIEIKVLTAEFERLKSIAQQQQANQKLKLSDFTSRESLKGITIGIALANLVQFSGVFTILTYSAWIFDIIFGITGTTLDPYVCSISLGVTMVVANLLTAQLADKLGRKHFMIITLLGSSVGSGSLALYLYLVKIGFDLSHYGFIPVICLVCVILMSCSGITPLSHVVRVENLPTKIRTPGLTICICGLNVTAFTCTKLFPLLVESIGMHGCMFIFCFMSVLGSLFVHFVLDETRGKQMDTIQCKQLECEEKFLPNLTSL